MSEKYRLFKKIPVVDILIVLALIVAFGAAIFVLTREDVQTQTGGDSQVKTYPFTATFLVERTASENAALIKVGDPLYNNNGVLIGTVTEVESYPYIAYAADTGGTGKQVGTALEGYSSLAISVEGNATACSNRGTYIGKRRIALSANFTIAGEAVYWTARVIDLEVEA